MVVDKETGEILDDAENEDDFGFYGASNDEEKVDDIKGITDEVSEYVFSDMCYPCICLKKDLVLPKHKWVILSKLVKQGSVQKDIAIYFLRGDDCYKAGAISGVQVKAIIDIIGIENLIGFYNKDKKLLGDRLYVLSD